jgi:hypothetical protein
LVAKTGRAQLLEEALSGDGAARMAILDWAHCPAVERVRGKMSEAWVLHGTRMPVGIIFQNLEAGANIDDIMDW